MYTYEVVLFGHNISIDEDLNNKLHGYDMKFSKTLNGKKFDMDTPYHGGGGVYPIIFGYYLTDTDNNPNFIKEIRSAKEEDLINDYNIFLEEFKQMLIDNLGCYEPEYDEFVKEILIFFDEHQPEFYSVQVSS